MITTNFYDILFQFLIHMEIHLIERSHKMPWQNRTMNNILKALIWRTKYNFRLELFFNSKGWYSRKSTKNINCPEYDSEESIIWRKGDSIRFVAASNNHFREINPIFGPIFCGLTKLFTPWIFEEDAQSIRLHFSFLLPLIILD